MGPGGLQIRPISYHLPLTHLTPLLPMTTPREIINMSLIVMHIFIVLISTILLLPPKACMDHLSLSLLAVLSPLCPFCGINERKWVSDWFFLFFILLTTTNLMKTCWQCFWPQPLPLTQPHTTIFDNPSVNCYDWLLFAPPPGCMLLYVMMGW